MKPFISFFFILLLLSCSRKGPSAIDREIYDKGYNFLEASEQDSAFKYFNKAKDYFIQNGYPSYAGNSLVLMGIIQCDKGDYYGAQETALSAIKYLDKKKDSSDIVSNYNNLGITCQKLREYRKAAQFYDQASRFSKDSIKQLTLLNNKAVSYTYLKEYNNAISIYKDLLLSAVIKKDSLIFVKIYDNLAFAQFKQNHKYNAEPDLMKAVRIREVLHDNIGLNASFSHLTDFFENSDSDKALLYAKKKLHVASLNKSSDDKLEALQKIIELERPDHIKVYFNQYQLLKDSLETARNKSKSQFAIIRFDAEKLKTENAQKENQILIQNIGIFSLSILLISSISGGFIWYKRRKKRHQQEKELEVKNTELKLSKKVHDVVANGIYQVMTKIENQEDFDKEEALDELEFVYEKSRDISYEKADTKGEEKDFSEKISKLIAPFNNENVKTYLAGNDKSIWKDVHPATQGEVYQIIRELLVNMKKHSEASSVSFRFERAHNTIKIYYTDNGKGISGEMMYKNGLTNTGSRIAAIHGEIIFDTKTEKGLKINISFPVS